MSYDAAITRRATLIVAATAAWWSPLRRAQGADAPKEQRAAADGAEYPVRGDHRSRSLVPRQPQEGGPSPKPILITDVLKNPA